MSNGFPAKTLILAALLAARACAASALGLKTNDVVAVIGGGASVAAARTGHFETILAAAHPGHQLRFRSLAWEGDTVFEQPREVNYPSPFQQLATNKATVCIVDFGQAESYAGTAGLPAFAKAFEALIDQVGTKVSRIIVTTPLPVFAPPAPSPAPPVAAYAEAIRDVARRRTLPVIDLYSAATGATGISADGRNLTPFGVGRVTATALRFTVGGLAVPPVDDLGRFTDAGWENLRQAVIGRNGLWKNYVRPTNWAFLGGDRIEQPSSRDHLKMSVRWFPAEIEEFVPLIAQADRRIDALSRNITPAEPAR